RKDLASVLRLHQAKADNRVRQFVEILHETLHARVDKPPAPVALVAFAKHEARNIVQQSREAEPMKGLAQVFAAATVLEKAIEQLQSHEFLACYGNVCTEPCFGTAGKEVPRLVNRLGPAGKNQRPLLAEFVCIGNQIVSAGAMDL